RRERSPVARIAWSEWAAPASLEDHLAFVREQHAGGPAAARLREYLDLVARAGPLTTEHEVVVTLPGDRRRGQAGSPADPNHAAIDAFLEEVHLLAARLEQH